MKDQWYCRDCEWEGHANERVQGDPYTATVLACGHGNSEIKDVTITPKYCPKCGSRKLRPASLKRLT